MTRVDSKAQGSARAILEGHDVAALAGGLSALRTSDDDLEQTLKVQAPEDELVSGQAPPTDEEEEEGEEGGGEKGGDDSRGVTEEEEAGKEEEEQVEGAEEGAAGQGEEHKDTILFIGDLARGLTEDDLEQAFSVVGKVVSIDIKRDKQTGRNLGYGFLQMETHEEAEEAKAKLQDTEISGRKIRIGWAQRNTALFVGDLDDTVTTEELRAAFEKFGPVLEDQTYVRTGKYGRFGFVKFKTRQQAETARREMHGAKLRTRVIRVVWHHPQASRAETASSSSVSSAAGATGSSSSTGTNTNTPTPVTTTPSPSSYVPPERSGALPWRPYCVHVQFEVETACTITEAMLLSIFAPFGEVIGVTLPPSGMAYMEAGPAGGGRRRGFAFVNFMGTAMGRRCATESIRSLHGQVVQGIRLQCSFSKKPAMLRPAPYSGMRGRMSRVDVNNDVVDYSATGPPHMPGPAAGGFHQGPYTDPAHPHGGWHQQMPYPPMGQPGLMPPGAYPTNAPSYGYPVYPHQNYYSGPMPGYSSPYYYYGQQPQDYHGQMGPPPYHHRHTPSPTASPSGPLHHHPHHHQPPPPPPPQQQQQQRSTTSQHQQQPQEGGGGSGGATPPPSSSSRTSPSWTSRGGGWN